MLMVVGLGNPGRKYENTRHNIGFKIINALVKSLQLVVKNNQKFTAEIAKVVIKEQTILLVAPQTYMNNSGVAVAKLSHYYNINNSNITVFHDELDLQLGRIKFKIGGGSAGHNGVRSIDANLGKDYTRIRIGIGRPSFIQEVSEYVLNNFTLDDYPVLQSIISHLVDRFPQFISHLSNKEYNNIHTLINLELP